MSDLIEYQVQEGVAIIRINRPEARNALNWAAQRQFAESVAQAAADSTLRSVVITGAGDKAFASGGDMKELIGYSTPQDGARVNAIMGEALKRLTELPIPVIAAVNGDAVGGGCEIMSACDLRLAAADARFCFAQIRVGLITGWGGMTRMIHLVGAARALELALTGRFFDADEARSIGFVQRLVKRDEVLASALAWAHELQSLPGGAMAAFKRFTWRAVALSLDERYELEKRLFVDLWPKADHLEAMAAFNEKRRPRFNDL